MVPANTSGRGRNTSGVVKKFVKKYSDSKNNSWECISTCGTVRKGNAQISRILAHASTCNVLKQEFPELHQEAVELSSAESLSAKLEQLTGADSDPKVASASRDSTPSGSAPPAKKLKGQATLDISQLQGAGKKKKEETRKAFQLKVDHIIMRLICVRGLVPNVIDSSEWKELMEMLNSDYHPTSSSTFSHDLIPKEAAYVRSQQIELLKLQKNLTLTFDGTTIRKPQSLYTVHAITPLREIYFVDGHEGSNAHHTTAWLKDKLISTLSTVGVSQWAATCSDNTNVTKAARREVSNEYKTILTVNDCVHHLHLAIKDITTLGCFKSLISMMQSIIQHFSHSTYSTTLLRQNDGNEKPLKALQTIGKTRFGTYWLAAQSLEPCLQQIQKLVSKGEVKFKNEIVQGMFLNKGTGHYSQFEKSLLHYLHIVEPFIRSLWSLEAARANASDVFVFWCAVAAVLKKMFDKGPSITGIPSEHAEKVIVVFNKRYKEMFADHLYFTAFTLDPRFALEDFLKQKAPCPVSVTAPITFTLPRVNPQTGLRVRILAHHEAYEIAKEFLKDMLKNLLISIEKNPDDNVYPVLKEYGAQKAADQLKAQLESFWRKEWPFTTACTEDMDPLAWWEKIAPIPSGDVLAILAIKIFSILVNSMLDERTNSTITWFNSKQRGSQQSRTIVDMIQIGQWHGNHKVGMVCVTLFIARLIILVGHKLKETGKTTGCEVSGS
ncbi:Ribonuclease H-like domain containing protein [Amanita muscaria]